MAEISMPSREIFVGSTGLVFDPFPANQVSVLAETFSSFLLEFSVISLEFEKILQYSSAHSDKNYFTMCAKICIQLAQPVI